MKISKKIIIFLIVLILIQFGISAVELVKETKLTNEALYFWADGVDVTKYGSIISPHGDCMDVVNGYVFMGWYKGGMDDRHLMISRPNGDV